jgi:hypothetical protein
VYDNINNSGKRNRQIRKSTKEVDLNDKLNYDLVEVNKYQAKPPVSNIKYLSEKVINIKHVDVPNEYSSYTDQKFDGSVGSLNKTREDGPEEYRLEQRFPDVISDNAKNLGNIVEETAESISSDDGKHLRSLVSKNAYRK